MILCCRYDGNGTSGPIDNIALYVNGDPRPGSEEQHSSYLPNTNQSSATIELGHFFVNSTFGPGTVDIDELFIWEEELPCDDIIRLFEKYTI